MHGFLVINTHIAAQGQGRSKMVLTLPNTDPHANSSDLFPFISLSNWLGELNKRSNNRFLFGDHLLVLLTYSLDDVLISLREKGCLSLLGLEGFLYPYPSSHTTFNYSRIQSQNTEDAYTEPGLRAGTRFRTRQFFAFPPFSPPVSHMTIKRRVKVRG